MCFLYGISKSDDIKAEIEEVISATLHCGIRGLQEQMKIRIYKTFIRPLVLYGPEICNMTKQPREGKQCGGGKILRKMYIAVVEENELLRVRTNQELNHLYNNVSEDCEKSV